jgi:hypothetical protein
VPLLGVSFCDDRCDVSNQAYGERESSAASRQCIIDVCAQVTVDVAKITCDELFKEQTQWTSGEIILWLSGYYHGEGHNTIVQPGALKRDEEKLNQY